MVFHRSSERPLPVSLAWCPSDLPRLDSSLLPGDEGGSCAPSVPLLHMSCTGLGRWDEATKVLVTAAGESGELRLGTGLMGGEL